MLSDLRAIESVFAKAKCPEDVFGDVVAHVKHEYRKLVQVVHPDHYPRDAECAPLAQRLMAELTKWYDDASMKIISARGSAERKGSWALTSSMGSFNRTNTQLARRGRCRSA